MSKAFLVSILVSLSALTPGLSVAAPLYVVDVQRVVQQSIAGKSAKENLQGDIKKVESKVAVKKAELDRLQQDLQKQAAVLSEDARDQREQALREKSRDLEKLVADERDGLKQKSDAAMDAVVKQLNTVLAQYSAKMGYKIILQKDPRLVLYVTPEFDLTDDIIKAFDAEKLR